MAERGRSSDIYCTLMWGLIFWTCTPPKKPVIRRWSSFPPPLGVPKLRKMRRRITTKERKSKSEGCVSRADSFASGDLHTEGFFLRTKPSWKNFTLSELRNATDDFNPVNIIGRGGYSEVYRGQLENGQPVAVKKITRGSPDEIIDTFLLEFGATAYCNHPNTARLIGVGVEEGMHLVFHLSPLGSLEALLHGSKDKLDWAARYKIALGTAEGLEYLHEKCQRRIIHRDIKAANILLFDGFEPQIGDFGLAKWLPEKVTHHTVSSCEGTFGYVAPEYCSHGIVNEKTDVFAFGVLLLELITGREAVNSSQQSLVMWAKSFLEQKDFKNLVDPFIGDSYDPLQMEWVSKTASMCIQQSSILRPPMSQVVKLLKGEESEPETEQETIKVFQIKQLITRTYSEELLFDEEE